MKACTCHATIGGIVGSWVVRRCGLELLFIHQNFPAQFTHLAPALAAKGHRVTALTMRQGAPDVWQGVHTVKYTLPRGNTPGIHPWVGDFESKVIRAEAVFRAALELKAAGYSPDVIVAIPAGVKAFLSRMSGPLCGLGCIASSSIARMGPMWDSTRSSRCLIQR